MTRTLSLAGSLVGLLVVLSACGGGGGSGRSTVGTDTTPGDCGGNCATATSNLSVAEVQQVIAQGVAEANALGVSATIAVVDRVGNVLAVFRMAPQQVLIATELDANGAATVTAGLEGIQLPNATFTVAEIDHIAAISKAVTGAYLSTEGNAFSTRTASQIVQRNFNPGETNQPGGPLFGVQFSQLACSDFNLRFTAGADAGPKRSPLGLSADPGGFPLYKGGTPVGAVGVISDGLYSLDLVISDSDRSNDELIATAATFSFAAPVARRADQITVDGKTFRYSDVDFSDLVSDPATAPGFASLTPADGAVIAVTGYSNGTIIDGTVFGAAPSGIRADASVNFPGQDAFIFVDSADIPRFPPIDSTDAGMTAAEVQTILSEALAIANRARAQIRRPLGDTARVTISVVDTNGVILGMVRTRDAPVFGADVSLQKARTAAFISSSDAATFLQSLPPAIYAATSGNVVDLGSYVVQARTFFNDPLALTGLIAFADRSGGNISRPNYPDGRAAEPPGPFSKPPGEWSPFSTGLQLDLANNAILQHVLVASDAGLGLADVGTNCIGVDAATFGPNPFSRRLGNGLQIFPGSVPIYRGSQLIGGIGVSGDGIDQDDMISFLGLHNAGVTLGGSVNNAPPVI
ncbi:MAG: heme-binding protein, partial [Gammaproteobacteria bacterium]|nr:heme-binding protein [Gammaproteobacteria bacterium]